MFKCKQCRYWRGEKFENTTMKSCNVALYLIKQMQKEGLKIYLTDALKGPDDICRFIDYDEASV